MGIVQSDNEFGIGVEIYSATPTTACLVPSGTSGVAVSASLSGGVEDPYTFS